MSFDDMNGLLLNKESVVKIGIFLFNRFDGILLGSLSINNR